MQTNCVQRPSTCDRATIGACRYVQCYVADNLTNKNKIMDITENQKQWIKWMLKGMGLDGSPKEFTKKERLEMQILVDNNLAYIGKNHSKAKHPMYYIPNEHQNRIREHLESVT